MKHVLEKEECELHGKVKFVYCPSIDAWVCTMCISHGLYNEEITKEVQSLYAELFAQ